MSKLSERLADILADNVTLPNYLQDYEIEAIREAAALARRVEGAAVRMVGDGISYGVSAAGTGIVNGQRERLVPEVT